MANASRSIGRFHNHVHLDSAVDPRPRYFMGRGDRVADGMDLRIDLPCLLSSRLMELYPVYQKTGIEGMCETRGGSNSHLIF